MQAVAIEFADAPIHQRRAHKRFDYAAPCLVQRESHTLPAMVRNISRGGINLELQLGSAITVGKTVTLAVSNFGPVNAVVRWHEGQVYGMQFLSSIENVTGLSALITRLEAGNAP